MLPRRVAVGRVKIHGICCSSWGRCLSEARPERWRPVPVSNWNASSWPRQSRRVANASTTLRANSQTKALTAELLVEGSDETSNLVIDSLQALPSFQLLARAEAEAALLRDREDQEKLATGVAEAVARGVLEERPQVEPVCRIQTEGKSVGAVAGEIRRKLGDAPESGCVLVLQGRSGTGKSTLAKYLQAVLPRSARWSNGNVFRALTLLALHHCQKSHKELGAQLTHELLQMLMSRLEFGKFREDFDIKVSGLGDDDVLVSEIANTLLKEPEIGRFVPTVAAKTQGEVVNFAANAAQIMQAAGMSVLMEGRSQSLDYIRTPHRFELIMNDANIIGERRAAQRVIGAARAELLRKPEENVHSALELALRRCSNSDGFSLDTPALRSAEPRLRRPAPNST